LQTNAGIRVLAPPAMILLVHAPAQASKTKNEPEIEKQKNLSSTTTYLGLRKTRGAIVIDYWKTHNFGVSTQQSLTTIRQWSNDANISVSETHMHYNMKHIHEKNYKQTNNNKYKKENGWKKNT
jgi:hypothetical protein